MVKKSSLIISSAPEGSVTAPSDSQSSAQGRRRNTAALGSTDAAELEDVQDAGPQLELREWVVPASQHGERMDKTLVAGAAEFSRSYLQQLVQDGAVEVNGVVSAKASSRVRAGDRICIALHPTPQSHAFQPQAMDLQVVFEDAHLLVINKPAGLVVHPAPGNWSGTLLNGLLAYDPVFHALPRAGIVHRLDKDTSGLMLVARSRPAMDALVHMIAERTVQRQYLALAHRIWSGPVAREVASPIGRDPRNRLRMAVVDLSRDAGKAASTHIELLQNAEAGCLVRCSLQTGRTHQIRVHMASIGHPLVADETYSGAPAAGLRRQALHAFRLALPHPMGAGALQFLAPLPADMDAALAQWGLRYNPL